MRLRRFLPTLAALAVVLAVIAVSAEAQSPERHTQQIAAAVGSWTETPIELAEGERATVDASGSASWNGGLDQAGPGGVADAGCQTLVPELMPKALLARVGTGTPVLAQGATLAGPGRISFAFNDCPEQFFDNSGAFEVTLEITRVPAVAAPPPPQVEGVAQPSGGGAMGTAIRWLLGLGLLALLIGGAVLAWPRLQPLVGTLTRPRHSFHSTARLESSAWLAPMRLRDIQDEKRLRRALTIGGPDQDIDFGVNGLHARLLPTEGLGTRIEQAGAGGVLVNGQLVVMGQRLTDGNRVRIGVREFIYYEERMAGDQENTERRGGPGDLNKRDPRAA